MSFILLGILNSQAAGAVGGAGDYELLETTVLGSSASSVSFTSLNSTYGSTYKHLQIRIVLKGTASEAYSLTELTFNGDTTSTNYRAHYLQGFGGSVGSEDTSAFSRPMIGYSAGGNVTSAFGAIVIDILDPFSTTKNTTARALSGVAGDIINLQSHLYINTAAITSADLSLLGANDFIAGSRFSLYGIKAA